MRVYDPLYGQFEIPAFLSELLVTPEVRRLSQIRLLNTLSPTMATLGELRRYSHTLGVLFLCGLNKSSGFSEAERKALSAGVLLHDIGTPPFGHLMEYHLRENHNWSHEKIIKAVLWGHHAPENTAHQIFGGKTIEFRSALNRSEISLELVEKMVTGKHPLSILLFGTIDLDNLDNVARMAWALGISEGAALSSHLAESISVGKDFRLQIPCNQGRELIQKWLELRKRVYDIIVFDFPTVAAQAVLSEAIGNAIHEKILSVDDWSLSDEELLESLRLNPLTKNVITQEYLGRLPRMVFCAQIAGKLGDIKIRSRENAKILIETVLNEIFSENRVLGYVFIDNGTFEKKLTFYDPETYKEWDVGVNSSSIIFYGFIRSNESPSIKHCRHALQLFLDRLGITSQIIKQTFVGSSKEKNGFQFQYPLDVPSA